MSPDGNGNPTSLRGTKQSRGLQWTAGITIEKMPKMVLLKKNKTHRFKTDGFWHYFTIFILEKKVPLEMERK